MMQTYSSPRLVKTTSGWMSRASVRSKRWAGRGSSVRIASKAAWAWSTVVPRTLASSRRSRFCNSNRCLSTVRRASSSMSVDSEASGCSRATWSLSRGSSICPSATSSAAARGPCPLPLCACGSGTCNAASGVSSWALTSSSSRSSCAAFSAAMRARRCCSSRSAMRASICSSRHSRRSRAPIADRVQTPHDADRSRQDRARPRLQLRE